MEFLLFGLFAGYVSAALGISASCFLMPLLVLVGIQYNIAVNITVMTILLTSITSSIQFNKGLHFTMTPMIVIPAAITAIAGDFYLLNTIPPLLLQFLYVGIMFYSADLAYKLATKPPAVEATIISDQTLAIHGKHHTFLYIYVGILSGLMVSLLGIGASLLMVPLLIFSANFSHEYAIKHAVTTTIVVAFFSLSTEMITDTLPYYMGILTAISAIIGSFFGILTHPYIKKATVEKSIYRVCLVLGFTMLMIALVNSL